MRPTGDVFADPAHFAALDAGSWIVVDDDDWRLQGQEAFLANRTLRWSKWSPPRADWDHDHCAFCWTEIGPEVTDHCPLDSGWVTEDDEYHWVCRDCFEDFRERFNWSTTNSA